MLYWDLYFKEGMLKNPKVMLTIHNMDNTVGLDFKRFKSRVFHADLTLFHALCIPYTLKSVGLYLAVAWCQPLNL
jgi:hypothetical protein